MRLLDEKLFFSLIKHTQNKKIGFLVKFVAVYSSVIFLVFYGICIAHLIATRNPDLLPFIIGPALSLLSVIVIRRFFKRKRPFETYDIKPLIVHEKGTSFPSKHGTSAFAIAFAMMWLHPFWGGIGVILASLTGLSRIMVGVHYPSDILGGLLIAIITSVLTNMLSYILL
ncbi:MAG: phosphatase PAP2 family protein [Vallitaleaceae bacterium]|nr:phosphatase PAP2 family protein [Vallitaleaceae bacterium]